MSVWTVVPWESMCILGTSYSIKNFIVWHCWQKFGIYLSLAKIWKGLRWSENGFTIILTQGWRYQKQNWTYFEDDDENTTRQCSINTFKPSSLTSVFGSVADLTARLTASCNGWLNGKILSITSSLFMVHFETENRLYRANW